MTNDDDERWSTDDCIMTDDDDWRATLMSLFKYLSVIIVMMKGQDIAKNMFCRQLSLCLDLICNVPDYYKWNVCKMYLDVYNMKHVIALNKYKYAVQNASM